MSAVERFAVFREQMEILCSDWAKYVKGDPRAPWSILKDSLSATLGCYNVADCAALESRNAELEAEVAQLRQATCKCVENNARANAAEAKVTALLRQVDELETRVAMADGALTRYKEALDCVEFQYWDVRCESGPIADTGDYDVWFEVGEHCHGTPNYRVLGKGSTPLAAIEDAQRADDDPAKSTYVPAECSGLEDHESGEEGS